MTQANVPELSADVVAVAIGSPPNLPAGADSRRPGRNLPPADSGAHHGRAHLDDEPAGQGAHRRVGPGTRGCATGFAPGCTEGWRLFPVPLLPRPGHQDGRRGLTPRQVMLSFMGKDGDPYSGARQFPLQGSDLPNKIIQISNVVAAGLTQSVGYRPGLQDDGRRYGDNLLLRRRRHQPG